MGDVENNDEIIEEPDEVTEDNNVEAFAEIISEKDKKLEELSEEINKLKKANAEMLLRISSDKPDTFDFDKAVMAFDTRTIR